MADLQIKEHISVTSDGVTTLKLITNFSYKEGNAPCVWDIYINDVRRRMNATHLVNLYKQYSLEAPQKIIDAQSDDDLKYPEVDLHERKEISKEQNPYVEALNIHREQIENLQNKIKVCEEDEFRELNERLINTENNLRLSQIKLFELLFARQKIIY